MPVEDEGSRRSGIDATVFVAAPFAQAAVAAAALLLLLLLLLSGTLSVDRTCSDKILKWLL